MINIFQMKIPNLNQWLSGSRIVLRIYDVIMGPTHIFWHSNKECVSHNKQVFVQDLSNFSWTKTQLQIGKVALKIGLKKVLCCKSMFHFIQILFEEKIRQTAMFMCESAINQSILTNFVLDVNKVFWNVKKLFSITKMLSNIGKKVKKWQVWQLTIC